VSRTLSIFVDGITLRGRCGVTAEERALGQTLVVDVRLDPAECPGAETDELEGTANYGRVVEIARLMVEGGEFNLLERLATVLLDALWDEFDLTAAEVAVAKVTPPVSAPASTARVRVSRTA
jgi:dihydroneopterin aldolase